MVSLQSSQWENADSPQSKLDLLEFQCLKHSPYSPDLAPMDFAVFTYTKSFLRGMRFDNLSELRQAVMNVIFHMKTDQFVQIFDDWVRRHKKYVELNGDYVEKSYIGLSIKNFYRCAPGVSMLIYKFILVVHFYLQNFVHLSNKLYYK